MVKFTRDGHNGCIQRNSRAKMVIWGNVGSAVGVAGNKKYDGKLKKYDADENYLADVGPDHLVSKCLIHQKVSHH